MLAAMEGPLTEPSSGPLPDQLPASMRSLFWEVDFDTLRPDLRPEYVMARVLERGRLVDVQWLLAHFGLDRIHRLLREVGHVELSQRTVAFWRCVLDAKEEPWAGPPSWKKRSSAPWLP